MFEFGSTQMTKANTQSCNKFNFSIIFTIKNTIGSSPEKFQDIIFKSTKASDILNVMFKTVPLNNCWGKKKIFENVLF